MIYLRNDVKMKGLQFIYIFVGALIGLIFAEPIDTLAAGVAENTTGITSTIYGYLGTFYALCLLGMMVGSLAMFFYSRRR